MKWYVGGIWCKQTHQAGQEDEKVAELACLLQ